MAVYRRARIKTLIPIVGKNLELGEIIDLSTSEKFSIEVKKDEYILNEVVDYTPGRVGVSPLQGYLNLYPATVKKIKG